MSAALYAVPMGTSCSTQCAVISSAGRLEVHSATMPLISAPRAARSASVANRGSSARSGRPMARHRREKLASDPATMQTKKPSAVG